MNMHVGGNEVGQPRPAWPDLYALALNLNGIDVANFAHGEHLVFDSCDEPRAGDLVVVHLRSGASYVMTLECELPPDAWARMPYRDPQGSTALAVAAFTLLGTSVARWIKLQDCLAIHRRVACQ